MNVIYLQCHTSNETNIFIQNYPKAMVKIFQMESPNQSKHQKSNIHRALKNL